jgi:NitT/TauT family transport system substrate-binding protein
MQRSTVLSLLALAAAAPLRARGADVATVRVASNPIESECSLYAAQSEGFFSRAGIAVTIQSMKNGAANAAAILSGSLDVAGINMSSLLAAHEKKIPFTILALGEIYTTAAPTTSVLVPKDSPVASARDLSEKTVAVNVINGLGHLATRAWTDKNGGDATAVHFTEMPFDTMPAALAAHRIDAALVAEPALSVAKHDTRVLASVYDAIAPTFLISAWIATEDWIAKNPDAARRFNQAMRQSSIWSNRNRDKTAVIAGRIMDADIATIRSMTRATFAENQRGPALVQPVVDTAARYHLVSAISAADLFSRAALG